MRRILGLPVPRLLPSALLVLLVSVTVASAFVPVPCQPLRPRLPVQRLSSSSAASPALKAWTVAGPASSSSSSSSRTGAAGLGLFQRRRPSRLVAAAAAAAPAPQAPANLLEKVKAAIRSVGASLPLVAFSTISGGVLAGSLHAVTGPDHLAALLPRCIGKRWYQAMRIGAVWGLGHGISAILMGMVAFFLKGRLSSYSHSTIIPKLSLYTEVLIGVSLIVIGLLGLKEAASFETAPELAIAGADGSSSGTGAVSKEASTKAVFLNGLLHGFSWDGTPTLAPALAFDSWLPVMTFLCSYGLGTMLSMSTATSLIGEGTVKVGQAFDRPNIPKKLAQGSSVVAILVGLVWTAKAVIH